MSDKNPAQPPAVSGHEDAAEASEHDALSRFLIEGSGVRGVLVRLTDTWREVRTRADYPESVAHVLGETLAAAALFTGHAKIAGRLSVQLRGDGPLRSVFAECTSVGTLRGLAHFEQPVPDTLTPRSFGADALMAITIENPPRHTGDAGRYQGLVPLDADSLPEAFEHYFNQSEQLPTRILLAADASTAAGIMLQRLPESGDGEDSEEDGWRRASALLDTLDPAELRTLPVQQLLYRLFNQDGVRLLDSRPLRFGCSCSAERVAGMLQGLGREESMAAAESGTAQITCEFCSQTYRLTQAEIEGLFSSVLIADAPERLQ